MEDGKPYDGLNTCFDERLCCSIHKSVQQLPINQLIICYPKSSFGIGYQRDLVLIASAFKNHIVECVDCLRLGPGFYLLSAYVSHCSHFHMEYLTYFFQIDVTSNAEEKFHRVFRSPVESLSQPVGERITQERSCTLQLRQHNRKVSALYLVLDHVSYPHILSPIAPNFLILDPTLHKSNTTKIRPKSQEPQLKNLQATAQPRFYI